MEPRRRFGNWGEDAAAEFLEQKGYTIVDRNYTCSYGEIDIIAQNRDGIVFVEVKSRRSLKYGRPAMAVTKEKQAKIRKSAFSFLRTRKAYYRHIRFDVIEVVSLYGSTMVNHLEGCF